MPLRYIAAPMIVAGFVLLCAPVVIIGAILNLIA